MPQFYNNVLDKKKKRKEKLEIIDKGKLVVHCLIQGPLERICVGCFLNCSMFAH